MAQQQVRDMELKEKLSPDQFKQQLRQWVNCLEQNQDWELQVKGQQFTIPADALNRAKLEVEYEIDKGEFELEFKMKWR